MISADRKVLKIQQQTGLEVMKERVKCYIWSIALYGAETVTLWKVDQKYVWKVWTCGAGEGWRKSVGPIVCEMRKCYRE